MFATGPLLVAYVPLSIRSSGRRSSSLNCVRLGVRVWTFVVPSVKRGVNICGSFGEMVLLVKGFRWSVD